MGKTHRLTKGQLMQIAQFAGVPDKSAIYQGFDGNLFSDLNVACYQPLTKVDSSLNTPEFARILGKTKGLNAHFRSYSSLVRLYV